jgi:hypothetical protein
MLWQSIGMISPMSVQARTDQITHRVVHTAEVDHHHHADQSLHVNEAGEFDGHQHADGGPVPPAVLAHGAPHLPCLPPATPAVAEAAPYAPPCLDGLLRPPMTRT